MSKEKVVLITGGGTGLGKALAIDSLKGGMTVVICGRREEVLQNTVDQLTQYGNIDYVCCDVRLPDQVQTMHDKVVADYDRIDVLVNNAAGNFICPAEKLSFNGWNAVINIVLNGTFYCSSVVGKSMIKAGGGNILNIIATYAWAAEPGVIHSASAKAGVLAMTRTLAAEWARYGIRVNAIAPGAIRTEGTDKNLWVDESQRDRMSKRIPLRRFGSPEDIAKAARFLMSEDAAYITGECLTVDGGGWFGKGTYEMVDMTAEEPFESI